MLVQDGALVVEVEEITRIMMILMKMEEVEDIFNRVKEFQALELCRFFLSDEKNKKMFVFVLLFLWC